MIKKIVLAFNFDGVLCDSQNDKFQDDNINRLREHIGNNLKKISPILDSIATMITLKSCGVKIGIISSNSENNIKKFLSYNQFPDIDFLYGDIDFFEKERYLAKLRDVYDGYQIYYVGDEVRDVFAAKKAGINSIAFTGGMGSLNDLLGSDPDMLINKLKYIPSLL
ncbi:MAG: HAD-IA family hydrolase [Francisellaceae bacterium]|jgi:phosphoglycolate phosphatase|nr:HAD-IA family hydrolase [Francisellaceae bacterium]MBT6538156.1 HAD-IA family hydrolase [Francisellaceae bacterium]